MCIAACILRPYTGWGAGVTILPVNFHSLVTGFSVVLFILSFQLFKTRMSTICKEEETLGPYLQELSHQDHNKRLFGLSRFDAYVPAALYLKDIYKECVLDKFVIYVYVSAGLRTRLGTIFPLEPFLLRRQTQHAGKNFYWTRVHPST